MRLPPGTPRARFLAKVARCGLALHARAGATASSSWRGRTQCLSFYHTNRAQRPRRRPTARTARPVAELRAAIARAAVYKRAFPALTFLPASPRARPRPWRELQYAEEPPPLSALSARRRPSLQAWRRRAALDIDLASISLVRSALSRAAAAGAAAGRPSIAKTRRPRISCGDRQDLQVVHVHASMIILAYNISKRSLPAAPPTATYLAGESSAVIHAVSSRTYVRHASRAPRLGALDLDEVCVAKLIVIIPEHARLQPERRAEQGSAERAVRQHERRRARRRISSRAPQWPSARAPQVEQRRAPGLPETRLLRRATPERPAVGVVARDLGLQPTFPDARNSISLRSSRIVSSGSAQPAAAQTPARAAFDCRALVIGLHHAWSTRAASCIAIQWPRPATCEIPSSVSTLVSSDLAWRRGRTSRLAVAREEETRGGGGLDGQQKHISSARALEVAYEAAREQAPSLFTAAA